MSETFREAFTRYLAIGMTYDQFWNKESWLVRNYREAQKLKNEATNHEAWLNGIYILQALQTGIPVMLTGIAKEKVELPKYPDVPIDFEKEKTEKQEAERQKQQMELQRAKMLEMAEQFNRTFRRKHGIQE